eukprot:2182178-Rhodomonas_salina.1
MEASYFLAPVDENFLCSICFCVMVSPCACSQGHQFCRSCISTWQQESQTCPSRCGDLTVGNLAKLRALENMIIKLQARCCNSRQTESSSPVPENRRLRSLASSTSEELDSGFNANCDWSGPVEDRGSHLRKECIYSQVECRFEGCSIKALRFDLAEHESSCEHRLVSCDKCEERIQARDMDNHVLQCRLIVIRCPQSCSVIVLRKDLGEHARQCTNAVVDSSSAARCTTARRPMHTSSADSRTVLRVRDLMDGPVGVLDAIRNLIRRYSLSVANTQAGALFFSFYSIFLAFEMEEPHAVSWARCSRVAEQDMLISTHQ